MCAPDKDSSDDEPMGIVHRVIWCTQEKIDKLNTLKPIIRPVGKSTESRPSPTGNRHASTTPRRGSEGSRTSTFTGNPDASMKPGVKSKDLVTDTKIFGSVWLSKHGLLFDGTS